MVTLGYVFIGLSVLLFSGLARGRNVIESVTDIRDIIDAAVTGKYDAISEVNARRGSVLTTVESHGIVSTPMQRAAAEAAWDPDGPHTGSANAAEQAMSSAAGLPKRTSNAAQSIIALGKALQAGAFEGKKIRVGEHPSFGGVAPVHTTNSYHYKFLALDLNYDGQKESEKAVFDRLTPALIAAGYRVIWWTKGHFDHIHVDTGKAGRQML